MLADTATTAAANGHVDWNERRQAAGFPAIRLTIASDQRPRHMTGADRYRPVRVLIDCMARSQPEIAAMREAVITLLLQSTTFDGVRFGKAQSITVRNDGEMLDQDYVHRDQIDVVLWNDG